MFNKESLVLGIETSCDETGVAVVAGGERIVSNVVASQIEIHQRFGGVVPEVASRQHILAMTPTLRRALADAGIGIRDLSGVAVTYGPGLAGALLVGVNAAKAIAFGSDLPLIGVNHIEAHIYANWLTGQEMRFPLICLIVSGAHSDLVLMEDNCRYRLLGRTRDDAAGEAFDKIARMLDLGYPGGPAIERLAKQGRAGKIVFPRAWMGDSYDFSFSGLKTAVLRFVEQMDDHLDTVTRADIAAGFQEAVVDVLASKTARAAEEYDVEQVLLAGGVAANLALRERASAAVGRNVIYPPLNLCTDNAAMIAANGFFQLQSGIRSSLDLDVAPGLRISDE